MQGPLLQHHPFNRHNETAADSRLSLPAKYPAQPHLSGSQDQRHYQAPAPQPPAAQWPATSGVPLSDRAAAATGGHWDPWPNGAAAAAAPTTGPQGWVSPQQQSLQPAAPTLDCAGSGDDLAPDTARAPQRCGVSLAAREQVELQAPLEEPPTPPGHRSLFTRLPGVAPPPPALLRQGFCLCCTAELPPACNIRNTRRWIREWQNH